MEITEASEKDIPEIVELLKLSLGESLMPKSERYWRWKHLENPFGPSPVLLCWEGRMLIGVRAFMRWEWTLRKEVFRAVRAVDTATHPEFQGRGIFKKLTLSLVEYCKQQGDRFVFNTPNQQSKPGYLKMGWKEAGTLPIRIYPRKPLRLLRNLVSAPEVKNRAEVDMSRIVFQPALSELLRDHCGNSNYLVTNSSVQYLKWRYVDVPVAKYVSVFESSNGRAKGMIVGRIKSSKYGTELRITDCFLSDDSQKTVLIEQLRSNLGSWGVDYITSSGTQGNSIKNLSTLGISIPVGPTVTVRQLEMQDLGILTGFKTWHPSLGDLELF